MTFKELIKSNIPRSILIIALYILYAIAGALGEYLFKNSLNNILKGNLNGYIYWTFIQAGMEIGAAILLPIATIAFTKQTQSYLHHIREEIMQHYYNTGNDEKVSEMQNQLTGNLKMLTTDFATPWVSILSGILEMFISIGILLKMNWSLVLVSAILLGINFLIPKIMEKKTAQAAKKVNVKNEKLLNAIEHWLGGLQELRRFSAYGQLRKQLHQASDDYTKASKESCKYNTISYLLNGWANALAQAGLVFFAGILFINRTLSFGEFAVAGSFGFTVFSAIWEITSAITQIKSTKELRQEISELRHNEKRPVKASAYGISVKDLKTSYDQGETISYPDFTIKAGEKVLLTGDSGTGKSTLFKVLLGKLKAQSGTVTYLDKNNQPLENATVGYLPQDPIVFPVSIKDNITMFTEKLEHQVLNVVNKVQLSTDLAKMPAGVNTIVDLKNENLSGGQRQKVVLARSEIHRQPFVLMDEVTSAIDQKATEKIIDELLKTDQTVLMIAHNFTPELKAKFDHEIKLEKKGVPRK
ncbi:glutathione/cysteine ABC transporter ATP-binding protein [Lactobacillus taiwanensis]|uniref:ATP-binding cassette domain-containing protein n=1 Tax=Lactobacillus taiwanensis TaxID=508451 RepID=UPI000B999122|nr:ABC transporter ATP-binding protein [Lactobacillus taiwanensis]OYS21912.1 glutathione/cysteine ABC transporter ATP-binding protein [Lactobacillus taiwanensis]OYS23043.1 glutathione/cysteine ABC transporter ATP-binding protein [Lactobacillus taiwanensis]OYS24720.1 glutathione/cysteine ABC transporter ATP-binding protein [Lactobacillus taiwanensis]OYS27001.1 glutathione/cysteine ABC transporter ATP-binding protein [Lactobacillus taiwanensis]OYS29604.1 glutathione/cysteine ABC transporter ATP-